MICIVRKELIGSVDLAGSILQLVRAIEYIWDVRLSAKPEQELVRIEEVLVELVTQLLL